MLVYIVMRETMEEDIVSAVFRNYNDALHVVRILVGEGKSAYVVTRELF